MKNGYFILEQKQDGLYMNIYAPKENGERVSMEDIVFVLEKKRVQNVNLVIIKNAIDLGRDTSIRIGELGYYSEGEWMDVKVSPDGLIAVARFFPAFKGGSNLTYSDIISELRMRKIVNGIDEKCINTYLNEREYGKRYIVAQGRKAIEGKDAILTYLFDTDKKPLPKIKEDGSVDFYDLDNISHVKSGDVVAKITKEVEGQPGKNVYGDPVMPRRVERKAFRFGRGLHVSEDGTQLISDVSGHITLDGDRISVSNTYEVGGNVDFGTGNIEYDGNVVIKGNVMSGFTVRATGNIEVRGIVEGATLVAEGNVFLARGMQGMQQGIIIAGDTIVAKFIENAKSVEAKNRIEVGAIMHSNVTCGCDIVVEGKNGLIIGGRVMATKTITAKNVGSEMGTTTNINVGILPEDKKKAEELKVRIKELNEEKEKLTTVVTLLIKKNESGEMDPAKLDMLKKTRESYGSITKQLGECIAEYNEINANIQSDSAACIKILGSIYPGVKIGIGEVEMYIKEREKYCRYQKDGADIRRGLL